jgi:hypothetical protein
MAVACQFTVQSYRSQPHRNLRVLACGPLVLLSLELLIWKTSLLGLRLAMYLLLLPELAHSPIDKSFPTLVH